MKLQPWKRVEPTKVTRVGWRTIVSKTFVKSNGNEAVWDMVNPEGDKTVNVIALTPDKKVIIARQFRPGPEAILYDLPGGMVDEGEDHQTAAIRELREETGYEGERIEYMGRYIVDGWSNTIGHVYLAHNCMKVAEQQLDEHEEIEVEIVTISEIIAKARNAETGSAHIPLFMAYDRLKELEEE